MSHPAASGPLAPAAGCRSGARPDGGTVICPTPCGHDTQVDTPPLIDCVCAKGASTPPTPGQDPACIGSLRAGTVACAEQGVQPA